MVLEVAEEKMTLNYPGVGTSLKFLVLKMSHLVTAQVSSQKKKCQIDGNYATIELPSSGKLTDHDEEGKEFRFCFDAACNSFKMIEVLWCPPAVHDQQPFYVYKLKPTKPGMAYCV